MAASIPPIEAAFRRLWPEAALMNLLDDSLAPDLARDGRLTPAMMERFLALARYARLSGSDAILFTCSAFGPSIEACAAALPGIPVLKPNEAMIEEAVAITGPNGRIGLMATFAPTLASMPPEFAVMAPAATLVPSLAEGALAALNRGDGAGRLRRDRAGAVQPVQGSRCGGGGDRQNRADDAGQRGAQAAASAAAGEGGLSDGRSVVPSVLGW
jgi:hypothetical protein